MKQSRSVAVSCRVAHGLLALMAACINTAGAQDTVARAQQAAAPEAEGLQEIIVSARKQAESLIAVPVAVTAISSDILERHAASDLTKIGELAPQVIVTQTPQGNGGIFSIRGVGTSPTDPGIEQSVSINIDGIQVSRARVITMSMFDLAQVEVLKGPQALFFGKNSSAGVISLTSAGPTDQLQATAKAGYEFRTDLRFLEATVSGPVTDTLKVRLASRVSESAGYLTNVAVAQPSPFQGPDLPEPGAWSTRLPAARDGNVRLTVAYNPNSNLDGTLKVLYGRDRGNSNTGAVETMCPGSSPLVYGVADPTGDCRLNFITSQGALNSQIGANMPGVGSRQPYTQTDMYLTSARINYRWDNFDLTSVTGYLYLDEAGYYNSNFTSFCEVCSFTSELTHSFTQELRLSSRFEFPLNFTAGAFYENDRFYSFADYSVFFTGPDPRNGKYHAVEHPTYNKGDAISPFGQLRWNILPNLELAGGVRWTRETKSTHTANTFVNSLIPASVLAFRPENESLDASATESNVSPEATLSWHPTAHSTLYGAYKTGYKSGAFSIPGVFSTFFNADNVRVFSEKVKGFEFGYKAELFNRRLRIEADVYQYTYSNLQESAFNDKTFSINVLNTGKARVEGVEESLEWQINAPLTVRTSIAYNRARFIDFDNAQCYQLQPIATTPGIPGTCYNSGQNLSGAQLPRAPDLMGSIGGNYDTALAGSFRLGLNADTRYSSSFFPEETHSPFVHEGGFWLLNAGARLYPEGAKWEIALIGTNLANKIYYYQTYDLPGGGANGTYATNVQPPRQLLLQGTVRY